MEGWLTGNLKEVVGGGSDAGFWFDPWVEASVFGYFYSFSCFAASVSVLFVVPWQIVKGALS